MEYEVPMVLPATTAFACALQTSMADKNNRKITAPEPIFNCNNFPNFIPGLLLQGFPEIVLAGMTVFIGIPG
jgi:hypothetical protein